MSRTLDACQLVERSINKKYRKELWTPFMTAIRRYELIQPGDRIAVCISGGKDSMLMAKLMQELHRHTEVPFDLTFLVMDPGYNPQNRRKKSRQSCRRKSLQNMLRTAGRREKRAPAAVKRIKP